MEEIEAMSELNYLLLTSILIIWLILIISKERVIKGWVLGSKKTKIFLRIFFSILGLVAFSILVVSKNIELKTTVLITIIIWSYFVL